MKKKTDSNIFSFLKVLKASKKLLVMLAILGQLVSLIPSNIIKAKEVTKQDETEEIDDSNLSSNYEFLNVNPEDVPLDFEINSLRGINEKVFKKIDGSFELSVYNDAVHYLNNGKYEDIDNTLVEQGNGYVNKANDFSIKFPKTITSNAGIKLKKDDYKIDWRLIDSNNASSKVTKNNKSSNKKSELTNVNVIL